MAFSSNQFIQRILSSPRRLAMPIMTAPAMRQLGISAADAFRSGELQAQCLKAVIADGRADACTSFMDLSVEAEAFGCPVAFAEDEIPNVTAPILGEDADIGALLVPPVGRKRDGETLRALRLCAGASSMPLFGGMIGPFSLAGRLVGMSEIMMMAGAEPEAARCLLEKTSAFLLDYARAIKATGANGLIIAEPSAGLLSPDMCRTFAVDFLRDIIQQVKDDSFMVILHNCGRTEKQLAALRASGCDALHVGNAVAMLEILPQLPRDFPVMGNIDPVGVLKNASADLVYEHCRAFLKATADYPNLVYSTGCDVPADTPAANIAAFFRARDDYNRELSASA